MRAPSVPRLEPCGRLASTADVDVANARTLARCDAPPTANFTSVVAAVFSPVCDKPVTTQTCIGATASLDLA